MKSQTNINQRKVDNNILKRKSSPLYKKFVQEVYDRGLTVMEWCDANRIERSWLYLLYHPRKRVRTIRGGPVSSRIKKILIAQGLPLPDGVKQ